MFGWFKKHRHPTKLISDALDLGREWRRGPPDAPPPTFRMTKKEMLGLMDFLTMFECEETTRPEFMGLPVEIVE